MLHKLSKKDFLRFLPLLVLYILTVIIFSSPDLSGDEGRHLGYAENITHGYYTDAENPSLRNGPGYPLTIAIFKLIDSNHLVYKLFNALLLFVAILLIYKSLLVFLDVKQSVFFSYLLGIYPPFLRWMLSIHSEPLAVLLVCAIIYFVTTGALDGKKKITNWLVPGFFLGFLILTKFIFWYVILVLAVLYAGYYLKSKSLKAKRLLYILGVAALVCTPYLAYTYSLTGKIMYWGTNAGELLYWRTTPFENEFGDWKSMNLVLGKAENPSVNRVELYKYHGDFFEEIYKYPFVKRDSILKAKAIENIKKYPNSYFQKTVASASRLFFGFPESYTQESPTRLYHIISNMFFLVFFILAIGLTIINGYHHMRFEVLLIGLMTVIAIGGIVLLNGSPKHLVTLIPLLFYFTVSVLSKFVTIKIGHKQ